MNVMAFCDEILSALGYAPDPGKVTPNRLTRFATSDRRGDKAGWCMLFSDGEGGAFGCWRQGISGTWQARTPQTAEEKAAFTSRVKLAREEAASTEAANGAACRKRSDGIWASAMNADSDHPYLREKVIKAYGLRQYKSALIVPVGDVTGTLHGLQFIGPDGAKRFKVGTAVTGNYHVIGSPSGRILIAEGYATCATLHEITGHAVACAFHAGNLRPVAEALRAKYQDAELVFCADDDYLTNGNPGLTKATAAARAVGGLLATPVFSVARGEKDTDFNDLARLEGPEAVRGCIVSVAKPKKENPGLVFLDTVRPEPVKWLWPGYIPSGKITIIDGDPGLGKSTIALGLIARVTTGRAMPDDTPCPHQGGAVLMALEDGLADTLRPRLEAVGADLSKVASLQNVPDNEGKPRFPTLEDIDGIRQACVSAKARILLIDPLMAHWHGKTDSHRDQDVRRALTPLAKLAEELDLAVIVIRHLAKGDGRKAIYKGGGSIGIIGQARSAYLVARDPADESLRVFACVKNNLTVEPPALSFRLEKAVISSGDGDIETSTIEWVGTSTHSADALLAVPSDPEEKTAFEEAKDFLRDILVSGPVVYKDIEKQARQAGIADRTLKRAKKLLGVISQKKEFASGWEWSLPQNGQECQNTLTSSSLASFDNFGILRQISNTSNASNGQESPKDAKDANLLCTSESPKWVKAINELASKKRVMMSEVARQCHEAFGHCNLNKFTEEEQATVLQWLNGL